MSNRTCSVVGCESSNQKLRRGFCERHYYSWRKYGTPTPSIEQRRAARKKHSRNYRAECSDCGVTFDAANSVQKYCSDICRESAKAKMRAAKSGLTCYICGKGMARYPDSAPQGEAAHLKCRPKRDIPSPVNCPICGELYQPTLRGDGVWTRTCSKPCGMRLAIREGTHNLQDGKQVGRDRAKLERNWRKRRALLASVKSEPYTREEIAERDNYICWICERPVDMALEWPDPLASSVDHIKPISRGGEDTPRNVALAHLTCNWTKSDHADIEEVRSWLRENPSMATS